MTATRLLADVDLALVIPMVAIATGGLVAITAMLMTHQRKMAELLRRDLPAQPGLTDEIRALRGELADLRDRVNQQTLLLESRPHQVHRPEVSERLQQ